ncbi:LOW QUALITY PROTEIN: hypothetical protein MAR_012331 [Mya arenaria]|uniref:Endonuclease/exonuclease/phosphatase domain-containing protein n=1 Tax=Mya arenaria TaxID=6604 RepID=A0ABY7FY96_MYAAR|nr:LOW QUALITY PROTEIN: hypothetical protein MAR_012331 [Mya arenaria]
MNLNIIAWNVTGIFSSATYLTDTLVKHSVDICGIAEHWLSPQNIHLFDNLSSDYCYHAVCDSDLYDISNTRKEKVVLLSYGKKYNDKIVPLNIDSDRLVGIQLQLSPNEYMFFFQLYLPCSNHSISLYRDHIDKLYDVWYQYSNSGVCVFLGDFNAKYIPNFSISNRDKLLSRFLDDCNTVPVNCLDMCTGSPYSFVSYDEKYRTLIDFICIPRELIDCISKCFVFDDSCLNVSRHVPVFLQLHVPNIVFTDNEAHVPNVCPNWRKANNCDIDMYNNCIERDRDILHIGACDLDIDGIDNACNMLAVKLSYYADTCIPKKRFMKFLKPYWNTNLKNAHKHMRALKIVWCADGRPRGGTNKMITDGWADYFRDRYTPSDIADDYID